MSRPMVLVFLLLVLIITSQFEWKQQLVNDFETAPSISQKQQQISKREEAVKEKIIASHFPGAVYVSQSLHFKSPVYIGEEVIAEVQAVSLRENRKRYIAKFSTKCFKDGRLLVLDGEAMAILPTLSMGEQQ
ncbi:PREDICTED: uncharacterized protein LOC104589636 isoform X3 [Nelumbo nucifera]|uniref:Uncharacterized protein LOC104589636 isoform X3 n=1 Tax=Nelumbo nucifera TaxID=4432 RepID=A0A1U7ZFN7_NELNU|nr:PREDICTED: uncharacterized protein LOC104589636 isoform X3 [Nelumbo nucifera]